MSVKTVDIFLRGKKEHKRNVKAATKGSRIAHHHARSYDHVIDFNNAFIIDKSNYQLRPFLES